MTGQVALVTGSSRGIGLSSALALARAGFDVAVNARKDSEELKDAERSIKALGRKVHRAAFDVSKIEGHSSVLDEIENELGFLTTLVNNAGVGVISRGDPLDVSEESYDRCFEVNAKAVFFLTQEFGKRLIKRTRESTLKYSIVNITSSNATAVAEPRAEYCGSKAAAAMISKVFAVRFAREGISVFDVQPGLISTEMTKTVIESYQKRAEEGLCLYPRVGEPDELGKVVATLATGGLPYTTGQVISVDGGMLVPRF